MSRLVLLFALMWTAASAQQFEPSFGTQRSEFSTWTSFSVGGNGHVFGFAQNRSLYLTGIRYGWKIGEWKRWSGMTLRYTPEIIPAGYLRDRMVAGEPTLTKEKRLPNGSVQDDYVFGWGANPVGLRMNFRRGKRIQPLWDVQGGFLYFSRPVLAVGGSQFQFTIATGPGAQIFLTPRTAVTVGYHYHHLSNSNIAAHNPGTDTNQIYFSFSLFR